jgi:hypothetical protein
MGEKPVDIALASMFGIAAGLALSAGVLMYRQLVEWKDTAESAMGIAAGYRGALDDLAEEHAKFVIAVYNENPDFVLNWPGKTKLFPPEDAEPPWINDLEI